jgi:hypothetical protein
MSWREIELANVKDVSRNFSHGRIFCESTRTVQGLSIRFSGKPKWPILSHLTMLPFSATARSARKIIGESKQWKYLMLQDTGSGKAFRSLSLLVTRNL